MARLPDAEVVAGAGPRFARGEKRVAYEAAGAPGRPSFSPEGTPAAGTPSAGAASPSPGTTMAPVPSGSGGSRGRP